ncbi:Inner kinetochore subunit [Lachnellula hyalina]|uniref:Inner kinetochore subunit n=1 Tax=Lachnellula hyalina TaxID=1316788 RepID=A0A8H8R7A8_9HELO|nr:Inner kinetochore subunit [Lachnellula hyalina]TVY28845.1 Inner kinetochore subunit [Lachnellula hyalina]
MSTNPQNGNAPPDGSSARPPRITPRNSDLDDVLIAAAAKETPYGTLRQLANIPRPITPLRRASSAGPPSQRSTRRTPAGQLRTPGAAQRIYGSGRRAVAVTPHGRAAQRELEARRAGLTPARKDRRRSGRQQRETPRDTLRALSRILAPKTLPIVPTPHGPRPPNVNFRLPGEDDLDDGPELERPRLSLPIGDEEDDDDSLLLPPQSAGLEDENFTVQSVELGRRAISEQPLNRFSRGSFGSVRLSDQFADLNQLEFDGRDVYDSSIMAGQAFEDDDIPGDVSGFPGHSDNTETLRDLGLDRGRISLASGRNSDIQPGTVSADDTETFVFTVPPRDVTELQVSDQTEESLIRVEDEVQYELPYDVPNENVPDEDDDEVENIEDHDLASSPPPAGMDISLQDTTLQDGDLVSATKLKAARKKRMKISKHGIQYPSLPVGVVKKLATSYAQMGGNSRTKLSKDTLDAIMQASDWFFEQVSDDLGAYAKHAGRKTIDESDIVTLMARLFWHGLIFENRQRQTNATTTPFSLAQRHLPRELLQDLRMVPPSKLKKGRQLERVAEEAEE